MITWIVFVVIVLVLVGYYVGTYFHIRRMAKFVDNDEFSNLIHSGQLIDIRESTAFRNKHILGARNLPAIEFTRTLSAIRKDKPVLIYDSSRSSALPRIIKTLRKAGYRDVYVLSDGFDYWTGRVKVEK